ncbi:MAG: 16S rRNA (adenine1518-N6/adenine1519-N6)-dimethyltransferase [Alphaproteobacteria bacterium]|jgi:16S rRNA (adenine1518-N6/adenine1519-N6)-dimethyltransferase
MPSYDCDAALPPLKTIIKEYQLSANKALGQNFLLDMNLLRKIAKTAKSKPEANFLEIGAGPGGLTRALLGEGADKVVVIEKDSRCIPILEQIQAVYEKRLQIIHGDALDMDYNALFEGNYYIATNLPYNISSEFITRLLTQTDYPKKWFCATMMLQKEFAVRMHASENSKEYGRLSVLCALTCQSQIMFDVKPSNFTPPPKVMSSIVQIIPHQQPPECDLKTLEKMTRATFGQRRKMLRSSLKQITDDPQALCKKADIDCELRADHLSPQDYVKLCQAYSEGSKK